MGGQNQGRRVPCSVHPNSRRRAEKKFVGGCGQRLLELHRAGLDIT